MKNRDNFPKLVISRLERRVNGHCSNPDCRVSTSGPSLDKDSPNCIGIAAHIAAAAPGGPRYNKNQSNEERKSIENAIWLCNNCATRIDKDEKRYTVAVLRQWKRKAEQDALEEMGVAPVSRRSYEVVKSLALDEPLKRGVSSAVHEVCRLTKEGLEAIDPRFAVDVEYKNNKTTYVLNAQVDVDCSLTIDTPYAEEFIKKYSEMVDHGAALEVDMEGVLLEGSPLFAAHNRGQGKLIFESKNKRNAVCKIHVDGEDQKIYLDDVKGFVTGGRKSIKFAGDTFDGCLVFDLIVDFSHGVDKSSKITLSHSYSAWSGKSVFDLPYMSRMYKFYEAVVQKRVVHVSLEINGDEAVKGKGVDIFKDAESRKIYSLMRYIRNVREVAKYIGVDVTYKDGIKIDSAGVSGVEELYNIIFELPKLKGEKIGGVKFTVCSEGEPSFDFSELMSGKVIPLHLSQEFSSPINMFGEMVHLPKINISYSAMKLVESSYIDDRTIEVSLEPATECLVNVYLADGSPNAQNS